MAEPEETLREPIPSVQRIMWTGTIWFATVVIAVSVLLGLLLHAGWRPSVLPLPLAIIWWLGAAGIAVSLPLIGWSGCPVLSTPTRVENERKSRTIALGTGIFIGGFIVLLFATLAGPA